MKIKISASLKVKPEHENAVKEVMPTREKTNEELKRILGLAMQNNEIFESWNITGWIE